jgi:MoxR-like ATPase
LRCASGARQLFGPYIGRLTTEQLIILGFLALAFLAGWIARALVGRVVNRLSPKGPVPAPASERSEIAPPDARDFKAAVRLSRDELARAVRAYHAAVVRTFRNGADGQSGQSSLEALSVALVSLARAVDHEARALGPEQELTARLQSTGSELRRLADDVMQHSQRELPAGVFDQLEQHLISAASMILEPSRP